MLYYTVYAIQSYSFMLNGAPCKSCFQFISLVCVAFFPGDTPNELVNTVLSLAINSSDDHSKASNSNLVRTVHWTSPVSCYNNFISSSLLPMATQAIHAPVKEEVSEEPKFSCPFCFEELVDAASTICGHIFCHKCIEFSIQAQSRCPSCWRGLTMNSFHRVYLPATMD
uniref:RING-type domain-containing protein n=1 Tax=Aegilops tauschii subsp. strangulata TaxID=200361 RepID=A0A453GBC3_AEGTS